MSRRARTLADVVPLAALEPDGLSITTEDDGTTVLRGSVVDQAALHGLLQKLRDVGIPLISLKQVPHPIPTEPTGSPTEES